MNYNITAIRPKSFLHTSGFREVMDSLAWALSALGHQANVTENWIDEKDTNIIFGAELLAFNQPKAIPAGSIIYNLEQATHPNLAKVRNIVHTGHLQVWDYSRSNFESWRQEGANAHHVPIGYTPNLTRIPPACKLDIDVLFLGWMTPRRVEIIQKLRDAGLNVVASDKCYGGGRDNLISRAKICLNVHHDGRDMFEIVRMSYLLANRKMVISETSSDEAEYKPVDRKLASQKQMQGRALTDLHVISCPYDELVEICRSYVYEGMNYEQWGEDALNTFKTHDYIESVRKAISEPTPQEKVEARYAAACAYGDMKDFAKFLKENARGTVLEIGTRDGASSAAFLSGLQGKGDGVLLSVDIDDCSHLFAGHPQWKFIQADSKNPKLKVPPLDVLLIDGDHAREGYKADFERFYPLVKEGGLILTHDIHPEPGHEFYMHGLREEFFRYAKELSLEHYTLAGYAGMGVMKKPVRESEESWQASEALLSK